MHVYPAHLTDCPWCALDNQGVIYFIDLGEEVITTGGGFCAGKSLGDGDGVSSTASIATAITRSFPTTGRPLPLGLLRRDTSFCLTSHCQHYRCCFAAFRQNRVISFWFLCWRRSGIIGSLTSKAYKAEVQQRREAFNRAKMDYDHLVRRSSRQAAWKFLSPNGRCSKNEGRNSRVTGRREPRSGSTS